MRLAEESALTEIASITTALSSLKTAIDIALLLNESGATLETAE